MFTIIIAWLIGLTLLMLVLLLTCIYLYRVGENTRLETLILRARINRLPETLTVRAAKKSYTIPPSKRAEIDLTQFEYQDDLEQP
jgi:hypothetical protein